MSMWAQKQKAFTIVELLIVIVVIAILAAISIVAYNGIQTRSKVSATTSTVNAAYKKAVTFKTVTGEYPTQDEFINNRAVGSTVNNTGPQEARLEGLNVSANQPTATNGTSTVRYMRQTDGLCAWLDWWDYDNNRITTLSTTPASKKIDC